MSGDSDILLLLWALRSGVPATASCASTCIAPCAKIQCLILQQAISRSLVKFTLQACPMSSLVPSQSGLIHSACMGTLGQQGNASGSGITEHGLEAKAMRMQGSGHDKEAEGSGAGHRLRGEAAADAQHKLDWVWAGRSAHWSWAQLGPSGLRGCTVSCS